MIQEVAKVSLVLGSGGARGLVHIGVIQELEKQGYQIDEVVGSSIGALVGGMYASGHLNEFEVWVREISKREIYNFMDFTWQTSGVMKGVRVFEALKSLIPDMNLEDMPIPFKAIATDLHEEADVVFDRGSFYEAVRSSVAIPGVFTAVTKDSAVLVDGGVLNPLPLSHVDRSKGNLVVAVNLESKHSLTPRSHLVDPKKGPNSITILQEAYNAMRTQLAQLSIDLYKPDILINIPRDLAGLWDYDKADFLIKKGVELTEETLLTYKERLRNPA
ncbi:patatin-like phospholipase family protein [Sphingobacteriaceae bacterium WQ 2009]|uniref:Patatin-like phospholipase family protein n=1 Tax=Rhinopithecimicrobium faecis TaxID=2820698 RepID=A0A8T4HB31_9SPHI|nr:patatin-like phospholipase family protein [Sphingobacteriaceae bacterium WQ 2009]